MHILFFPLMVLSINRALDTVISRKPRGMQTIITDLMDTYRIGKFRGLYAGLVPATLFSLLFTTSFYSEKVVHQKSDLKSIFGVDNELLKQAKKIMPSDKTFEEYSLPVYRGQAYRPDEPPTDLESYIEERQLFDMDFVSTLALLGISNIMIVRMACIDYPMRGKML